MRRAHALALAALLGTPTSACRTPPSNDPPDPSASPQAKAEPAPIATPPTTSPSANLVSANGNASIPLAPLPQPMRPDEPPPVDVLPKEGPHEPNVHEGTTHESAKDLPPVFTVTFALRSSDVAPPPKGIELSGPGLEAARKKSEPSLTVDLTPGHARAVLQEGFVLASGTELRVREDRFGYVVVAPDGSSYRVAATGSLRAILGEGLFDVAPSSAADVAARGDGAKRLGRETKRVEVTTRAAKGSFELAHVPELGDSGALVCRMLLDLMSAGPGTPACADGDVPLHVELKWSAPTPGAAGGRGRISGVSVFDAVSLERRTDVPPASFLTPPPSARFVATGEAPRGSHLFLAKADLAALRLGGGDSAGAHASEGPTAVLSLHNSSDELRYAWLDGVPLAWLSPGGRLDVTGVPHARASVQWRTFLGDAIDPAQAVTLPATVDAVSGSGAPPTSGDSPPP